jgi:uncharacterized repeat protein (TIGR03803 family)
MIDDARIHRRTCLGLALGLAAEAALPRAAGPAEQDAPAGFGYRTIQSFGTHDGLQPNGVMLGADGLVRGFTGAGGPYKLGTAYVVDPRGRIRTLHAFGGGSDDGAHPVGTPVQDSDGALYGVTNQGGAANLGVAFRIGPDGACTLLHHFGVNADDGYGCNDGLLLASDGQLYGANVWRGKHNGGQVFRLGRDGSFTPLWQMGARSDPGSPVTPDIALLEGTDGRLYGGSMGGGGPGKDGTIYSLARDGSDQRVLHAFETTDGSAPSAALVQGADGFLYGTTKQGGRYQGGVAFRLAPDGSSFHVLHDFGDRADAVYPESPLLELEPGLFVGAASCDDGAFEWLGGALFALRADGRYERLHRFGRHDVHGVPDGQSPLGALCRLPTGELAGTCRFGGLVDGGTLWRARVPPGSADDRAHWGSGLQT